MRISEGDDSIGLVEIGFAVLDRGAFGCDLKNPGLGQFWAVCKSEIVGGNPVVSLVPQCALRLVDEACLGSEVVTGGEFPGLICAEGEINSAAAE